MHHQSNRFLQTFQLHSSRQALKHLAQLIYFSLLLSNILPKFKMFNLINRQCLDQESNFSFLIKFVVHHEAFFATMCSFCPFGTCYKGFLECFSLFQVVSEKLFESFTITYSYNFLYIGLLVEGTLQTLKSARRSGRSDIPESVPEHSDYPPEIRHNPSHHQRLFLRKLVLASVDIRGWLMTFGCLSWDFRH